MNVDPRQLRRLLRELREVAQRIELLAGSAGSVDLARRCTQAATPEERTVVLVPAPPPDPYASLVGRPLAEIERELVRRTLLHCRGNRRRTAEMLGIGVRTLFNKLQEAPARQSGDS